MKIYKNQNERQIFKRGKTVVKDKDQSDNNLNSIIGVRTLIANNKKNKAKSNSVKKHIEVPI